MSKYSDQVRKDFKTGDDVRDEGLTMPEGVIRYDDILYGDDEKWQVLDVYRPADSSGIQQQKLRPLPVIVSVHGGAWVYGDKERYQYYCMSLAKHGFAVVNFTYRLAPEYKYPCQLEDTNLVFTWVLEHAEEYGFDTKNIFAVGDSAGAHILSVYCAICTNEEYAKTYEKYNINVPLKFVPSAVALNCGKFNMKDEIKKDGSLSPLMEDLLPEGGTLRELEWISPEKYVTEDFPPTYLMTASGDFLKMQAVDMAARLTDKEVEFEYHFYGTAVHKLWHVFHVNMKLEEANLCNQDECRFFKQHIC